MTRLEECGPLMKLEVRSSKLTSLSCLQRLLVITSKRLKDTLQFTAVKVQASDLEHDRECIHLP
jgi:hypothetical protein